MLRCLSVRPSVCLSLCNLGVDFEDWRVDSLYVQSDLDARQTHRRTKVPGRVTSVVALVNPGLDCSPIGDHIESREICRIDGSIQSKVGVP